MANGRRDSDKKDLANRAVHLIEGTRRIAQRVRTNNAPDGDILALVEHAEKCADYLEEMLIAAGQ